MKLSPSAHVDTFCRDNLPPDDQWPDLEFTLPELLYPERLNAADELLNPTIAAGGGQPAVPALPDRELELRRNCRAGQPDSPGAHRGSGPGAR